MPTILRRGGYRFFFYSLEGSEQPHVHVERGVSIAKIWLEPLQLARSRGFRAHEISRMVVIVEEDRSAFLEAWREHFGR